MSTGNVVGRGAVKIENENGDRGKWEQGQYFLILVHSVIKSVIKNVVIFDAIFTLIKNVRRKRARFDAIFTLKNRLCLLEKVRTYFRNNPTDD